MIMDLRIVYLAFVISYGSCGIIIPEELPSLLSVAYSNIPPIKKGTDSRVGFGFAFGNHADFQVLLELGPQTNTQNLTGQGFQSSPGNAKRQAPTVSNAINTTNRQKWTQSEAGKYLQLWAHNMRAPQAQADDEDSPGQVPNLEDSMVELVKNAKGEYEIHQPRPGNMPDRVLDGLKRLYGQKKDEAKKMTEKKRTEEKQKKRSEAEVKKITADLSNVDLD